MTTLAYPAIGLPTASDWDDHPSSRTRLLTRLAALGDNVVLSGDLHFTIANDLVDAPLSAEARYDPASGEGSVGVELLASGVSRGNVDETACMGACGPGSEALFENIRGLVASMNPHNRFLDLTQHGYGVVDITAERVVAELWYSRVRAADAQETLGATLVTRRGEHRWVRDPSP
jgi:alkaline phosphatase D